MKSVLLSRSRILDPGLSCQLFSTKPQSLPLRKVILVKQQHARCIHSSLIRREEPIKQADIPLPSSSSANAPRQPFLARLRSRLRDTPVRWTPIPIGLGIAVLIGLNFWKQQRNAEVGNEEVKVKGPWQVHVLGALPLRTISRIYGAFNEYTLPNWFRVPGFKFYGWLFDVNFDEVPLDLKEYDSLADFFMREMKQGCRQADDAPLISPADGTVINFGYIENRRIESIKGATYSVDALLEGIGQAPIITEPTDAPPSAPAKQRKPLPPPTHGHATVDEEEFAHVNGISYSLDELMGGEAHDPDKKKKKKSKRSWFHKISWRKGDGKEQEGAAADASMESDKLSISDQVEVAMDVGPRSMPWSPRGVPKPGNKMFFAVVYLAPGDYHRFHSPTSWVVERRRHFSGELFSVSPYLTKKMADLFVLNERVALLGRWRYGFFSMVPVGATNVGRIVINFDKDLRTNSGTRPTNPGRFTEGNYAGASRLLHGQPLRAFDEMGGFLLGSTIVMVFEAPENFEFNLTKGQKIKVGTAMGNVK